MKQDVYYFDDEVPGALEATRVIPEPTLPDDPQRIDYKQFEMGHAKTKAPQRWKTKPGEDLR